MKKVILSGLALIAGMYLTACTQQPLSANELKQLFPDTTQTGIARETAEGTENYWLYKRADGTMVYKTEKGYSDEGKWWITDDGKSCTQFNKLRKGKERCSKIYKAGNKYESHRPDGTVKVITLESGNTKGL